jgi:rhomboid protease GluP
MDWNYLLLLLTAFGCGSLLWRSLRPGRPIIFGWAAVGIFVIAVTVVVWERRPQAAGFFGFAAWAALGLLPSMLMQLARRMVLTQRIVAAHLLAVAAALLHPMDGWPDQVRMLRAQVLRRRGHTEQALEILVQLARKSKSTGFMAQCLRLELEGRWAELAAWIDIALDDPMLSQYPDLGPLFLRSLGESGNPTAVLENYHNLLPSLTGSAEPAARASRMIALAFGGRRAGLEHLLEDMRPRVQQPRRLLWLATADQAAGNGAAATPVLEALAAGPHPVIAQTARQRLEHAPAPATDLSPSAVAILDRLEQEILTDNTGRLAGRRPRPWITWSLIAVNFAVFVVEIAAGGSTNDQTLERLGGLYPDLLARHQYWRLLTANFLHYGWEHILFNMLALLILGPFVEQSLGVVGFLALYFASGIGAMGGVLLLQHLHLIQTDALVGASGAIMGLVGATGAILLRLWRRHRAVDIRQQLLRIIWIVILQVVFDALTPMVSSSAHLVGLGWGFVLGLVWSIG